MQELHEETLHDPLISSHVIKQDELSTGIEHRRLVWVGPLTVLVSIGAVLLVRAAAVALIHPEPAFLPLSVTPAILDTAVLVTLAVLVFRRVASGRALPSPLLGLLGERFFTLDAGSAFRLIAFRALLISFLPDVGIAMSGSGYWEYALVLAIMHVAAWVACVSMLTNLMKPPHS
jgi:hypothetical protein